MGKASIRNLVLDTGSLIALDHGGEKVRKLLRHALDRETRITIPAGVLAQAWRNPAQHARINTITKHALVKVAALDEAKAKASGVVCRVSGATDVVDASVVVEARVLNALVITSDPDDLLAIDPTLKLIVI
jgi:hypothetical protein